MRRKFVKVTAACVGGAIVLSNAASVSATTLETDTAAAGMSVALNNYYATSLSPEADILAFLKPSVASASYTIKEKRISVAQTTATGESREIESTTIAAEDSETSVGVIKVVGALIIRKEPTTAAEPVGRAYNDSVVSIMEEVDGENGIWYHIISGDVEGYVKGDYVVVGKEAEEKAESLGQTVAVVTAEVLNVRQAADENSDVLTKVYLDEECVVLSEEGDFLKVEAPDGTVGYVHKDYVTVGKVYDGAVVVDRNEQMGVIESYQQDIAYCFNTEYPNAMNEGLYYAAERVLEYVLELSDSIVATAEPYDGMDDVLADAAASKAEAQDKLEEVRALIAEYEAGLQGTTGAPSTAAPDTEAPATTVAPTTQAPTTTAPAVTVPPTTQAPTTTAPTVPATTAPAPTEPETEPSVPVSDVRTRLAEEALYWVGKCNYVYGGNDLSIGGSIDCSGFTQTLYSRVAGIPIPRTSYTQVSAGRQISYSELQPGDLIFYTAAGGPGAINHVAIYVGGGMMVHAASPAVGIVSAPVLYKQPAAYVSILG